MISSLFRLFRIRWSVTYVISCLHFCHYIHGNNHGPLPSILTIQDLNKLFDKNYVYSATNLKYIQENTSTTPLESLIVRAGINTYSAQAKAHPKPHQTILVSLLFCWTVIYLIKKKITNKLNSYFTIHTSILITDNLLLRVLYYSVRDLLNGMDIFARLFSSLYGWCLLVGNIIEFVTN